MKKPRPKNSAIDAKRMRDWTITFSGYRHAINESRIDRWLDQFSNPHRDLAARILDSVDFIPNEQIYAGYKSLLSELDGWSMDQETRCGTWRFVPFTSSAGESGDSMVHKFRHANGLSSKKYNDLFIYKSELVSAKLGPDDTVVFIDDFSGSGRQAIDTWNRSIQELLTGGSKAYLILVGASHQARERIARETGLDMHSFLDLRPDDNIFSTECKHFDTEDRDILLKYCKKASKRFPQGSGNCGFVIVLAHNCPNNSIALLHASHPKWEGLFRRHD